MLIKTAELEGDALDWAVATLVYPKDTQIKEFGCVGKYMPYGFAQDWDYSGKILGMLNQRGCKVLIASFPDSCTVSIILGVKAATADGENLPVALARCCVAFWKGAKVNVPEEFT